MKKSFLLPVILLLVINITVKGQDADKRQIRQIIEDFKVTIKKKQKDQFHKLFLNDSIPWIGVSDTLSLNYLRKQFPQLKTIERSSLKEFIRYICDYPGVIEEKLFNVNVWNDAVLASVTFDYSYWKDNKPNNWGKEVWTLIKVDGQWKIAAVYYSGTLHENTPTPLHLM